MKKLFFILWSLMLLASCSTDEPMNNAPAQTPADSAYRTEGEAADIASQLYQGFFSSSSRSLTKSTNDCTVQGLNLTPLSRGEEESVPMYVVNFADGGFAVVGARKDDNSLYAVSDNGSLDINENEAARFYLSTLSDGGLVPITPADPDRGILWQHPTTGEYFWVNTTTETTESDVDPGTYWHQQSPFNDTYPIHDDSGRHYPAGCVPVAIGQICAYHQKANLPESINWGEMLSNPYGELCTLLGKANIRTFFSYLREYCKVTYSAKKLSDGKWKLSATASASDAVAALKRLGYTAKQTSSINEVYNSLQTDGPVYIQGKGTNFHAWIIIGYREVKTISDYTGRDNPSNGWIETSYKHYFKFNWGWGDTGNGYFLDTERPYHTKDPNDPSTEIVYSNSFSYIVNIK